MQQQQQEPRGAEGATPTQALRVVGAAAITRDGRADTRGECTPHNLRTIVATAVA